MAIVLFSGPVPHTGDMFCTVCSMLGKQQGLAALEDQVQAAIRDPADVVRLDLPMARPELAVAVGYYPPLGPPPLGNGFLPFPVPLCWSHLMGLQMKDGLAPASPAEMAAMNAAQGVPLVGRGAARAAR